MKTIIFLIALSVICLLLYVFRPVLEIIYICIRYGRGNLDAYLTADIKKFNICQYTAARNDKIKFYISEADTYIEGTIIGLTKDNKLYVLENSGRITWCLTNEIADNDIIYLK